MSNILDIVYIFAHEVASTKKQKTIFVVFKSICHLST